MPIDEMAFPVSLDATGETMTPQEKQNRFGMRPLPTIHGVGQGKFLTHMVVESTREMTPVEYFNLLGSAKTLLVDIQPQIQLISGTAVPTFDGKRVDLHTTAHLRVEDIPEPTPEPEPEPELEPEIEPEPEIPAE